jgi:bifunctional NMN adenylyltransferase/nudix hydrolase
MTVRTHDLAVVIGRFQPFHNGHARLLAHALAVAPRVVVVLGSAGRARSPKNPFSWQERAAMIAAALDAPDRARVVFAPVRDRYDDARWGADVRAAVPDAARVALVGHVKDGSSYYLRHFPHWDLLPVPDVVPLDATGIRAVLFGAAGTEAAIDAIAGDVPPAVARHLRDWLARPLYAQLAEEYRALQAYQAAWRSAPYPPVFVTVDAVVRAAGHVLLVQRGRAPGKGTWALPGGFVDPHERLLDAALRELAEETQLTVAPSALTDVRVFDHPDRSLRGRTITHAHMFSLQSGTLPVIRAADDAAAARWVRIADLPAMEETFHDDHFHILDEMLGLSAPPQHSVLRAGLPA